MNIKIPNTEYEVANWITQRWSARAFRDQHIDETTLNRLFEAASWSASSMNEQPWHYYYAYKGSEAFNQIIDLLMEGNQPWAKDANVILLSLAKKTFDRNGRPNRHAMHDVGAANTTLLLQAAEEGILGHMMGGFHMDKAVEAFDIDTNKWELACFIALGYPDEATTLEEPYKTRELSARSRNTVESFTQKL